MMKWLKHLCDGESAKVNVAPARDRIEDIHCFLDNEELTGENSRKLRSKRFAKKQQMQWTKKSAHLVLQMRTQVLDERLEETFRDWYPDFRTKRLKHPLFYALHACAEHLGRSLRSLLSLSLKRPI
jgi:hypothetical protein